MVEFKWDPWQLEFMKTQGDKILCCGRQVGKSEICSADAVEYAVTNPGTKPIVMIAPTERQAYGLFSKTLQYLTDKYPKLIMKKKDRPTQTRIRLKVQNKMVEIYCLPVGATGLGIRFLTIGRLYVDEASRLPELVWDAVTPALLTTGGSMIVLSTPHSVGNEFHRIWVNKDGAYDSFKRFSITSETVIKEREICETWSTIQRDRALLRLDQEKKRKSKRVYAQEYLGEFMEDLHRYFSDELINQSCTIKRPDVFKQEANYFLGVDLARMGEDSSTFQIIRRDSDKLVHVENMVTKKKYTTQTEQKILDLDNKYKFKRIYIDAGSGTLGVSIFDHLIVLPGMKKRLKAINNAKRITSYNEKGMPQETKLQKEDLYDNLRALMEQSRVKLLDDEDLMFELASVQYEYVTKEGQPTKLRIYANPSADIVEGLVRACWCVKEKINKFRILHI